MWSKGSEERVGQQASCGPGAPTPGCLRQRGSKATGRPLDTGVLGSPTLAVWRSALTGQSPCWHQHLEDASARRKGTVDKARGVSSAPTPHGRQRATCTPQVVRTRDWHARALEPALEPRRGSAFFLCLSRLVDIICRRSQLPVRKTKAK